MHTQKIAVQGRKEGKTRTQRLLNAKVGLGFYNTLKDKGHRQEFIVVGMNLCMNCTRNLVKSCFYSQMNLNLVPRSRMSGAILPLPQYVFMAWCLVKHRGLYLLLLPYLLANEFKTYRIRDCLMSFYLLHTLRHS
jgi:hypothetical protein